MTQRTAFGKRLKKALVDKGMGQSELARQLKTTSQVVNGWVNRGVIPEGRFLLKMPILLGCDGHWLLTGKRNKPESGSEWKLDYIEKILKAKEPSDAGLVLVVEATRKKRKGTA